MPQPSIAYAIGRVRSLAKKTLAGTQLERLMNASDYDEALHILSEMGWTGLEDKGVDAMSVSLLEKNCKLIREISPEPELTDSFMLRHDAQNLKALFKARILDVTLEALSECGTLPVSLLSHAVAEHFYNRLPVLPDSTSCALAFLRKSGVKKLSLCSPAWTCSSPWADSNWPRSQLERASAGNWRSF